MTLRGIGLNGILYVRNVLWDRQGLDVYRQPDNCARWYNRVKPLAERHWARTGKHLRVIPLRLI